MSEKELVNAIIEVIINNSNIEADNEDAILFSNVEDVFSFDGYYSSYGNGVVIRFNDGTEAILNIDVRMY